MSQLLLPRPVDLPERLRKHGLALKRWLDAASDEPERAQGLPHQLLLPIGFVQLSRLQTVFEAWQ
jgi:hypothetical protein